ncbi:hypothetical protein HPP92_013090 [Vanilla planifolia]|uniref:Uncharacterized protein n=1 Tax=Vanilla planifolia TaxID=51239 RepID=A0A835QRX9_VANPL|nr:hypothetical protein HPP92_013554 [Vanilla planifolia]KAG0478371.1 hypothetical protein HPP92_013090 [Vanilla planifolia]
MELHSPPAAKRLWNYLRVAFFMLRKGLVSKRRLLMDMNLMLKRGKLMGKSLGNLVFHHHRAPPRCHGFGIREYEFSCSNSPNPVFFHSRRTRHSYFPCLGAVAEEDETARVVPTASSLLMLPNSPHSSAAASRELSLSPSSYSPSSVRGSETDESTGDGSPPSTGEVDNDAEEFIRRFHRQLRRQSRIALLQYEIDYHEMLARSQ